jgi:sorbitol-specific phosphotransferase system component IIC
VLMTAFNAIIAWIGQERIVHSDQPDGIYHGSLPARKI